MGANPGVAIKKPFRERFFLALPGAGINLTQTLIVSVFTKYYTDILGLSPMYAGLIFLLYNIWNYVNDPLIGVFVDRFPFREGRGKYLYLMRASVPLLTLFLLLITLSSPSWSQALLFALIAAELFVFDTAMTVFNVSYVSYFMLAAPTKDDRIDVEVPRNILSNVFSVLVSLTASFLLVGGARPSVVAPAIAGIIAVNALVYLAGVAFLKEQRSTRAQAPEGQRFDAAVFRRQLGSVLRMRAFWTWFLFSLFALGCMEYFYTPFIYYFDWVVVSPSDSFRSLMFLIADNLPSVLMLLALPLIAHWIKRVGSRQAMLLAFIPYLMGYAILFLSSSALVAVFAYILILFGRKTAGTAKIPLQAAIIDENELLTGERKAGLMIGLQSVLGAPLLALQSAVFLFTIGLFGYDSAMIQSLSAGEGGKEAARAWLAANPSVLFGIRFGVAGIPFIMSLLGLIALLFFPYDRRREAELSAFSRRRQEAGETLG